MCCDKPQVLMACLCQLWLVSSFPLWGLNCLFCLCFVYAEEIIWFQKVSVAGMGGSQEWGNYGKIRSYGTSKHE